MPEPFRVEISSQQTTTAMVYPAAAKRRAGVTLILGHGAGADQTSGFMTSFAGGLAARGIDTITFNFLYGSPEISGHECRFDLGHVIGASCRMGEAGAQGTAQSERIRRWLVANRFQAISQASICLLYTSPSPRD